MEGALTDVTQASDTAPYLYPNIGSLGEENNKVATVNLGIA